VSGGGNPRCTTEAREAGVCPGFFVIKDCDLRLHPIVTKLVDADTLEKMGASKMSDGKGES